MVVDNILLLLQTTENCASGILTMSLLEGNQLNENSVKQIGDLFKPSRARPHPEQLPKNKSCQSCGTYALPC